MKVNFLRSFLVVLALAHLPEAQAPRLPVESHWLANTSGTPEGHIANFLTDMVVWCPQDPQFPSPLVLTASFWDEGSCGFCSYHEGKQAGKAEWWKERIHSDSATRGTTTCTIENLWGRAFLMRNAPPPVGDSAPYVACSGHDTLRSVTDPTALAFDLSGNLLVADNGPDQNVKIFSLAGRSPRLLRTFGDSGGVFAGPVPGKAGIRRFWGIRGLGVDSSGNVYVGNTGIPMQTMGGTDIRVFSGKDSSLLWQVQGLSFVNSADADPASDARSVFLNAKRFEMDWTRSPGQSWRLAGVTLDPFRFPQDPRIVQPMESVFLRRVQGRLLQFSTSMYGDFLAVHRFQEGSELAVPSAFFCLRDANNTWGSDSAPTWERNETNKRIRWYWIDRNGDGIHQRTEFGTYDLANIFSQSLDVDDRGHLWHGGAGAWSPTFRGGGIQEFPLVGFSSEGVPLWNLDSIVHHDIPFPRDSAEVGRLKYLADQDAMLLGTTGNYFLQGIRRYENWSDPARRKLSAVFDLGYQDHGIREIRLDVNTADMTLPMSFTSDGDHVYVGYIDRGRHSRDRGEIGVYDARTGRETGWFLQDSSVGHVGVIDLLYGLNARKRPDGSRAIFVEEDGFGKVMAFSWCPEGAACAPTTQVRREAIAAPVELRVGRGVVHVRAEAGSAIEVLSPSGARLWSGGLPPGDMSGWSQIPHQLPRGAWIVRVRSLGGTNWNRTVAIP